MIATNVIHPTLRLVLALGIGLAVANRLGWRLVSTRLDRERLIASARG